MALTAAQLAGHVRHTLGGGASTDIGGTLSIINEAGRFLFSAHPWLSANRAATSLDFTADQNYIALPVNFGEIEALDSTNSVMQTVQLGTLQEINFLRTSTVTGEIFGLYAAASYRVSSGVPVPVLEIWPTPATSQAAALVLAYKAKWLDMTDDNSLVLLPNFMESLLIELVRAYARGYEMEDEGSLSERVAAVMAGPIAMAAMRQDSAAQPSLGQLRGGAAMMEAPRMGWDQFILA